MLKLLHVLFWYLALHLIALVAVVVGVALWRAIKARADGIAPSRPLLFAPARER